MSASDSRLPPRRLMQQHQQQMRLQQQQQQQQQQSPRPFPQQAGQPPVAYPPQQPAPPPPPPPPPPQTGGFGSFTTNGSSTAAIAGSDVANMSERELAQLLTQKDLAASLAEDLIKQFAQTGDLGLEALAGGDTKPLLDGLEASPAPAAEQKPAEPQTVADSETQPESGRTKPRQSALTRADLKVKVEPARTQPAFHIDMTALEVAEACTGLSQGGVGNLSIVEDDTAPPAPATPPRTVLRRDQLLQQTPSVFVENKKEAFSPQMQEFCLKNPIAVIRGMAAALKLGEWWCGEARGGGEGGECHVLF